MNAEFMNALDALEQEKNIDKEILLEAIEAALMAAYKRSVGPAHDTKVWVDRNTGDINIYALKTIVEEVIDDECEITLEEARLLNPNYDIGDIWEGLLEPITFGRIAAQTAKQVVVQRIRETERNMIYDEYVEKQDEIVTASVQRVERKNVFVELGKTEGFLPPSEQMRHEKYYTNDRIKVYLMEVRKTNKGPQIVVSRSHPGLVKRLFEMEVPEMQSGVVEIVSIAREAGQRTKMAVYSSDPLIDPIGACVGQRGIRVERVVDELRGEKIDIINWSEDPVEYIANALSPAKVVMVYLYEEEQVASVVVPDNHLSLAIGREGQNARLAAKLTGWKIDIKSQSQIMESIGNEDEEDFEDDIDTYEDMDDLDLDIDMDMDIDIELDEEIADEEIANEEFADEEIVDEALEDEIVDDEALEDEIVDDETQEDEVADDEVAEETQPI